MKKTIAFLLSLYTLLLFSSCDQEVQVDENLAGMWSYIDEAHVKGLGGGKIYFSAEGYATMYTGQDSTGGKSFNIDGVNCQLIYSTNTDVIPNQIDFIVKEIDSGKTLREILCIYEFIENGKLKINLNSDISPNRPIDFSDTKSIGILEKK